VNIVIIIISMPSNIVELRDLQYQTINNTFEFKSVEINPIESCTRRCSFCPRSDPSKYPNSKNRVTVETCKKIAFELKENNFCGRIGFVGFGEPLLHPELEECIKVIRDILPTIPYIEVNTNGDLLTTSRINSLHKSGCTTIAVSMYDKDITEDITKKRDNIPIDIIFRHHYNPDISYNLNLVNRSNITYGNEVLNLSSNCYIPFYKLMIDWNGDLLPCDNDWSRTLKFGNINDISLKSIIEGEKFFNFRAALTSGKRTQSPCSKCNVCGTLRGEQEFNNFKIKHNL
jgi:radical SAM protein with 4Fe4S-binding SPASM domain